MSNGCGLWYIPSRLKEGSTGATSWLRSGSSLRLSSSDDLEAVSLAVGLLSAVQAGSIVGIEESSVQALGKADPSHATTTSANNCIRWRP